MKFLVLGGGTQGSAAAFDLLHHDHDCEVVVADLRTDSLHPVLRPWLGNRLTTVRANASCEWEVAAAMEGAAAVLCAFPYYFNYDMARLALQAGAHFTDLGGNTAIVERQRGLDARARAAGLSIVPDVGLAPGTVNILAQGGIDRLDTIDSVRLWVGGLPQHPKPPLNYQIVYSLEGMLDYYVTPAEILKDGIRTTVGALSQIESLDFPDPIGRLEAFHTGGGTSTLPARYEGRVRSLEYKTLRYPGHAHIMRAIRDLGLLGDSDVEHQGAQVNPRRFFIERVTPLLTNEDGDDMVLARVEAAGERDGRPTRIRYDVIDYHDPVTGLTAMARTTGFSLAIVARMQVRGEVAAPGVGTPDEVIPPGSFVAELRRREIRVDRSETTLPTPHPHTQRP